MMFHAHARNPSRRSSILMRMGLCCVASIGAVVFFGLGAWLPALGGEANSTTASPSARSEKDLPSSAMSDDQIIAFINEQIRAGWKDFGFVPSAPATDNEWCRRVYLDVLGRTPSVRELDAFLKDRGKDKKARLVDLLLSDKEPYLEDFSRHWANVWSFRLVGRPPANPNRQNPTSRDGMLKYLRDSFNRHKPYDTMVYELISAVGSNDPEAGTTNDDPTRRYNPAVNFLVGKLQENAAEGTARTARFFLGLQVQCTQCHNHPFNDWKQEQFWSMNAFFRQTRLIRERKEGNESDFARLLNQDFAGEGSTPKEAEIYYELRNGTMAVAYPTFVDGTKIDPSGYVDEVNRRAELAKMVIKSEYLGKALVNFMWSQFYGYGFTKPVDDLGPHNAPSHPELLDRLGQEFSSHGHDLRRLIRWLTLSDAYALSSKMIKGKNDKDDPTLGEKPRFSHFYMRQMQPEQLFETLLVATEAREHGGPDAIKQNQEREELLRQFTTTFDNDEGDAATTFNGTIPQALMMMNGKLVKDAISLGQGSFLQGLAKRGLKPSEALDYMYLAALGRKPSGAEVATAMKLAAYRGDDVASAYQDIWWALLNSNEFILIY